MEYTTLQNKLIMPEYGRNVQRMVEYAVSIEDKQERTECVQAIMRTMTNLFPYLKSEESKHKMYDHLAIMSDFRLDIDSPYERPTADTIHYAHERLPYNTDHQIRYRHYGKIIETMIEEAVAEQDVDKRQQLIMRIASRMNQSYMIWNKDSMTEQHLRQDIAQMSNGHLSCDFEGFQLVEVSGNQNKRVEPQKRNKKRKKQKH